MVSSIFFFGRFSKRIRDLSSLATAGSTSKMLVSSALIFFASIFPTFNVEVMNSTSPVDHLSAKNAEIMPNPAAFISVVIMGSCGQMEAFFIHVSMNKAT
jgi:hypothetical protein